eukprot:COSAG01_NODE_46490_length_399_cov_6.820000_1_plen_29_part_01
MDLLKVPPQRTGDVLPDRARSVRTPPSTR